MGVALFLLGAVVFLGVRIIETRRNWCTHFLGLFHAWRRDPVAWLVGLIILSGFLSCLLGGFAAETLDNWMSFTVMVLSGVAWFYALCRVPAVRWMTLPRYIYGVGVFLALLYTGEIILWKGFDMAVHSERFFLSMRKIGSIFAVVLPFAYLWVLGQERIRYWVGLAIMVSPVFICGGRSGVVAYVVMTVLFAVMYPWNNLRHRIASIWAYTLLPFVLGAVGMSGYYFVAGAQTFQTRLASSDTATGSGRTDIWHFALTQIMDHPFFGFGIQAFRDLDFSGVQLNSTMHPHNMILEIFLSLGFVGGSLGMMMGGLIFLRTVWATRRAVVDADLHNILLLIHATFAAIVGFVVAAQFLTSVFHGWWLLYLLLLLAIIGSLSHNFQRQKQWELQ